ncbi:MAG: Eco57I restriction-modification methylase domain-containing protein [Candidatus Wallbacteria bacterium]
MAISKNEFSQYIKKFDFRGLFNEMGWNNDDKKFAISLPKKNTFVLYTVGEKSGFKIFVCSPTSEGKIPDFSIRRKIETEVTKLFQEHLIIFHDTKKHEQVWQLVVRQSGQPAKVTETRYNVKQDPELLYQRASGIFFELDEEEKITIVDVTKRVAENFNQNNEKVTKQFYDKFKKEHTAFLDFINGIDDKINKDWYASLMLNRLMFCYFIQKKGFLDQNPNYLRDKLKTCQSKKGQNKFYSFYRNFLLALFHQGLGAPVHSKELKVEIGKIPYLNGGLFDEHELEKTYKKIDIDDKAFERIFDFFDQYEWHLDTRINSSGKDINPDVIGYIFEKYINDRAQMGAYYTKEDITEYISKNCILPFIFEETKRQYPKVFTPDSEIWRLLKESGDSYIYEAVKHGVNQTLPPEITIGLKDVSKRTEWNKSAPENFALPTEIWREVVDRRNRYAEVKSKIENGEINSINDFITYNLNIRQFTQDVVENIDEPEFIDFFYKTLSNVTIMDPTCGSGAFLFAAMNILEPLYEACIYRMESYINEAPKGKYEFFESIIAQVKSPGHPNLKYFIYKSIILQNLYGVDIMKEATEIAKLRLFLKLVATVDADYHKPNLGLEPLPDVDFNIRSGNTLIGYATETELQNAFAEEFDFENNAKKIKEKCDMVAKDFARYKDIQLTYGNDYDKFKSAKDDLNKRLRTLNIELNELLQKQTYPNIKYEKWLESYQPFHWFAEFYEIIHGKGGFDVVIGNPPYVEYSDVKYKIHNFVTLDCGNLYAYILEKNKNIINNNGFIGMIVPLSSHSTERMEKLVKNFYSCFDLNYFFNISADANPSKLFPEVKFRLVIFIVSNSGKGRFTTKYKRWYAEERENLFSIIDYENSDTVNYKYIIPKITNKLHLSIFTKLINKKGIFITNVGKFNTYYHNTPVNWIRAHTFVPYFKSERDGEKTSTQLKPIFFSTQQDANTTTSIFCSTLFYIWWITISDCYHLNKPEIVNFPFYKANNIIVKKLSDLCEELKTDLISKSIRRVYNYKTSGRVEYDEFYLKKSKPIIDDIDKVLAEHYGFTDEELDFIINYDIKYRMGKELEDEGGADE